MFSRTLHKQVVGQGGCQTSVSQDGRADIRRRRVCPEERMSEHWGKVCQEAKLPGHRGRVCQDGRTSVCRAVVCRASMTLECTMVLPLTLMIVFVIASYMNAVALQMNRCLKLSNTARKMAAVVSLAEGHTDGTWIDLFSCCRYEYPCSFLGLGGVNVAVRARVFPWVGRTPGAEGEEESASSGNETVYITDNRSVYHTYADCSHLDLTIYETTLDKVGSLRNSEGKRYHPCTGFPADHKGPIYISKVGTYYYPSLEYAGLTRNVHMTSKDACSDLCVCSRCAQRAAKEAAGAAVEAA